MTMTPRVDPELDYLFEVEGVYLLPADHLNKSPVPILPTAYSAGFAAIVAGHMQGPSQWSKVR